jgi:hypothetical protein
VAHSDGMGADAQVVEVGAIWRRMERAVGSVERGRMAGAEGTVWTWRGEGWASVGGFAFCLSGVGGIDRAALVDVPDRVYSIGDEEPSSNVNNGKLSRE